MRCLQGIITEKASLNPWLVRMNERSIFLAFRGLLRMSHSSRKTQSPSTTPMPIPIATFRFVFVSMTLNSSGNFSVGSWRRGVDGLTSKPKTCETHTCTQLRDVRVRAKQNHHAHMQRAPYTGPLPSPCWALPLGTDHCFALKSKNSSEPSQNV